MSLTVSPDHPTVDVAIIGAGPYGLSIAAHLRKTSVSFRIFGTPMRSWREKMPKGMLLKSDGFASSLYDPDLTFTLREYCKEMNLPYADVGLPVPCETFVAYGLEFQRRLVPMLEETEIRNVRRYGADFELSTENGHTFFARRVIVAAGITHFSYLPPFLAGLPHEYVTHSSDHHELTRVRGKRVAIIGAGASAVDLAALLNEMGAEVELVARRDEIAFHKPSQEPRPLLQKILKPRSGLGLGWRSRLCTDAPLIFRWLPRKLRFRVVQRHLGPAPGWFVREKVIGKFPMHMSAEIRGARVDGGKVHLEIKENDGKNVELVVDHVIGGTGFRVAISRLLFLEESLRNEIRVADDTPLLSTSFESSVPGLYLVGVASANSFGPLTRFAYGAMFTSRHITRHLAAAVKGKAPADGKSSEPVYVPVRRAPHALPEHIRADKSRL
jgi:cation diffusion facilitator CzcD-associated flavoprotein CzcO